MLIATDGSDEHGKGSYGWVLASPDGTVFARGAGAAYGLTMSSFRCEAYGILSALCFILHLQRYYHLPPRNITIDWWCDCNSLLQRLVPLTIPDPNRYKLADHDTELTFRYLQNQLPSITHNHLHSHLHDHTPLHLLPVPQKLNRIVDDIAKTYNKQMHHPIHKAPLLGPARCQIQIRGQTITCLLYTSPSPRDS